MARLIALGLITSTAVSHIATVLIYQETRNYGGHRHWFNCPSCSRRTSILYFLGTYVCRHCTRASYGSQLEQPTDNLFRRLNTIRARLGWQARIAHSMGERPKVMHRTTYNKIICEYMNLTDRLLEAHSKMLNI